MRERTSPSSSTPPCPRDGRVGSALAESALARHTPLTDLAGFHPWFAQLRADCYTETQQLPLDELAGWRTDADTGDLQHDSGRFFSVRGLDVEVADGPVPRWQQPIIYQPEVGILGLLVRRFDGVLHCLMQAKVEPGNQNGLQLSPTVQATRSNYTGVHRGRAVPYLEFFRGSGRTRLITDVRQSEQGSWFYQKRNRNMVVETTDDVPAAAGFCWLTLGQLHQLLQVEDLVNMDTRTVLSCLPWPGEELASRLPDADDFQASLLRSCSAAAGAVHALDEILNWITEIRSSAEVRTTPVPLRSLAGWQRQDGVIHHETGAFFDVIGVQVQAGGREVRQWSQPMIRPKDTGVIAFLASRIDGILHVLARCQVQPGCLDVAEVGPTVRCTPANWEHLPTGPPAFLKEVLGADPAQIRYDVLLSEEGGRFYRAVNRYVIVEVDAARTPEHPEFRWLALHQLADLLRHSHYVNVEARSLVACLRSLLGSDNP
ncbi:NDP-hexose 2,3-dehydratase family protein [Natronosporangium hydrolyticum]|uniref:NDP-hexose 2,3-dehydratase family protein n=1 Tax=Natronosporangium hydrolyticum TaxID=2811111 RepID=A0A895YE19_9ACTN|nr:NDP-hexose 2,3-dehydratase family protein [Natronosporangium hydrolyticum]QSB16027.1 NDP-hexose 2,3-dehydratase family protein [Natronosporangium hydrolyticum]